MSGKRQLVLLALAVMVVCVVFLPAASAATTDRVQVGRPGQNATPGFPLSLFVSVGTLPDYEAVGRFDGTQRRWQGPDYRAKSLGGKAEIDWNVTFAAAGSAAAMATQALGGLAWPIAERPQVQIPHVVGGRRVGSIAATALLTKGPGAGNAQFESVVAFPLCRGVFVAAQFAVMTPGFEYGDSPADPILVGGNVPAGQWNHDRALAALGQVSLDGYLPAGRVTARAKARSVSGTVRDCAGHAMAGIGVRLLRGRATVARARAAADGSYRLVAPGPGTYRVSTVALTVTGKGGSGTRQDLRAAVVRVR